MHLNFYLDARTTQSCRLFSNYLHIPTCRVIPLLNAKSSLSEPLGIGQPAVSIALARGEKLAKEKGFTMPSQVVP
jgi:hypothetical protein